MATTTRTEAFNALAKPHGKMVELIVQDTPRGTKTFLLTPGLARVLARDLLSASGTAER